MTETVFERKKIAKTHFKYLESISKKSGVAGNVCMIKNGRRRFLQAGDTEIYTILKRLNVDKKNMDSEVFSIGFPPKKPVNVAAVKIIPILNDIHDKKVEREILVLKQCTKLFMSGVSPNLPIYYGDFECKNTDILIYENPNITSKYERSRDLVKMEETIAGALKSQVTVENDIIYKNLSAALKEIRNVKKNSEITLRSRVIINELSAGDVTILYMLLAQMIKHYPQETNIFQTTKTVVFQQLVGIHILHEKMNIIHYDAHTSNFLFSFMPPGKTLNYVIDRKKYVLKTPYTIKIWDFGRALSKNDKNLPERITRIAEKLGVTVNKKHKTAGSAFETLKLLDVFRIIFSLKQLIEKLMPTEKTTATFLNSKFILPISRELKSGDPLTITPTTLIDNIFGEFLGIPKTGEDLWSL